MRLDRTLHRFFNIYSVGAKITANDLLRTASLQLGLVGKGPTTVAIAATSGERREDG
ncbi:hypothetical protein FF011L_47730 [Roseimaritima multifibrata]|uniref:Uncharacterized protein n=1 Tax=Roseimaritima multifibrata TaxID=1930274 RepID=A0A517MM69_9BACT|nr:hypothetical protein FF011L_47730 [Roseimaritima multifibrata]